MSSTPPSTPLLETAPPNNTTPASLWLLAYHFLILGCTGFGGPSAHVGLFETLFVERKHWLDGAVYAELLAVCQMLPGPTSTQMSFALGITQQGTLGGLISGLLFMLPGAVLMTTLGVGTAEALKRGLLDHGTWTAATAAGLSSVGVALIGNAALSLGSKICGTVRLQMAICAASAALTLLPSKPVPWLFPVLLVSGGAVSAVDKTVRMSARSDAVAQEDRDAQPSIDRSSIKFGLRAWQGACVVGIWACMLLGFSVFALSTPTSTQPQLHWFYTFFYTGSLVYGGGPVVLPVLQTIICDRNHWIRDAQFLAALGLAQAMPGPMFNLSPFLGAVIAQSAGTNVYVGALLCWLGIFAPGVMMIFGVLPLWRGLRNNRIYQRAVPGVSASAVGLIFASIFSLHASLQASSPFPSASDAIAVTGFALIRVGNVPAPLSVLCGGVLGVLAWACGIEQ
ncbi:hypothetical protein PPROV_000334200 [Pycnococcus provasolii]|uniref:Chromate transporter n=1 Tax=Pycnococcus provasolii TaxID=41880 RepID=A0A830HCX2_9CHLO|nr:hypothetical protein PPROV_000334200 [Pycnococcus provasolii]